MSLGQGLASKYYSGFNPLIYGNCALWVDAGDTTTLTLSGSNITAVRDKSPQSNAITVSTTQPTYVSNRQNGLGGIFMNGASWLINTTLSYSLANRTVFIVAEQTASSTGSFEGILVFGGNATTLDYNSSNAIVYTGRGSNAGQNISFTVLGQNGDYMLNSGVGTVPMPFRVYSESFAYPNGTMFIDACQTVTDAAALAVGTATGWVIGGRFDASNATPRVPLYGYIYEILVYSNTLPAIDRQAVESYLMRKWGRIANIPPTHPYSAILPVTRPFVPIDISGCVAWLDAADPATVALSGSSVTQWNDKSGNGYNAAVVGSTFGYSPTAFNTSYPGLTIGTFSTGNYFNLSIPANTFSNGIYGISVFRPTSSTTNYWMGRPNAGAIPRPIDSYSTTTNNWNRRLIGNGSQYWEITMSGGYSFLTQSNTLYYFEANPGSSFSWVEFVNGVSSPVTGTLFTSGAPTYSDAVSTTLRIYLQGTHCEHILFDRKPSTYQRQQLEGYLARKWGLLGSSSYLTTFAPTQISGCALWLDAADSATLTLSGSNVTQWNDKSGNGRNTSAITGTPILSSNTINSKQGVYFNGTSYFTGPFSYSSNTLSWFVVATTESSGDDSGRVLSLGTAGQYDFDSTLRLNALSRFGLTTEMVSYRNAYIARGLNITYGSPFMTSSVLDGVSNYPYINGTLATGAASTGNFGFSTYGISASFGTNIQRNKGHIFEVLIFTGALTATQRQQIEGYLAIKWGLQGNLPSTHPYAIAGIPTSHPMRTMLPGTVSFNPRQISNCALWLDAADPSTITLSGSNVTALTDKSGNLNNATQTTASNGPVYSNNGLVFNGSNWLTTPITSVPTAESLFIVMKYTTNTTADIFSGTALNLREFLLYNGSLYVGKFGTTPSGTNSGAILSNTTVLIDYQYTTTALTFAVNGTVTGSGTPPYTYTGSGTSYIGSSTYTTNNLYGTIYEIVYYSRALSSTERRQVEGYLAWKWGLQGPSSYITTSNTSPLAISGLAFWLDATDTASFTFSSGSNISQWRDKTSNAYVGTGVNSPTLVSNSLNGIASVNFNGTNQYINFGNVVNMGTSQIYVFVVSQHNSTANGALVGKASYRGFAGRWAVSRDTVGGSGTFMLIDTGPTAAAPAFTDTSISARLLTGYWNRSNVVISENGTQRATAALASSTNLSNTDPLYVAAYPNSTGTGPQAGLYLNGKIGEVLVYLGSLTTTQRQDVEGYLAVKWGLQSSLPSTHPYAIKGLPSTHPYKKISPI